ncbi:MAG: LysM peptidoglycan-binding domain-containing protein [Planctomycetota bacterium]
MGVMDERSSRIFVGLCLLVLLWIGTYWLYEPGKPASGADISFDPVIPAVVTETDDRSGPDAPPGTTDVDPSNGATAEDGQVASPGARVRVPEFREYVVGPGETFKSIARDELGNVGLWSAIARSNPLRDPRRLREGDVIRLPLDPTNIQGILVSGADGQPLHPDQIEPEQDPWVEYTVRSGDSLTGISLAYYGTSRHADAIFDANRDQLRSPDALRIGQVLLLPPITAED